MQNILETSKDYNGVKWILGLCESIHLSGKGGGGSVSSNPASKQRLSEIILMSTDRTCLCLGVYNVGNRYPASKDIILIHL